MAAPKSSISLKRQLLSLTSPVLVKKCIKYKLPIHGTKNEIVNRIIEHKIRHKKSKKRKKAKRKNNHSSSKTRKNNQLLQQSTTSVVSSSSQNNYIPPQTNSHSKKKKCKNKKHSNQRPNKKNKLNHHTKKRITTKEMSHNSKKKCKSKTHSDQRSNNKNKSHNHKKKRKPPKPPKPPKSSNNNMYNHNQSPNPVNSASTVNNIYNNVIKRWHIPPPTPPPTINNATNANKHQLALFIVCDHIGSRQLFTDYNYTIKQFKQQISDQLLALPLNAFRISIQNLKPLNKQHLTLSDYNIQRGTRIHVHLYTHSQMKQLENSFNLTIKIKNNNEIFKIFSVQATDTVFTLKKLIENKYNIRVEKQILSAIHGRPTQPRGVLNDTLMLNQYEIKNGDILYLEIKRINNEYFNKLLNQGIISIIDINEIYSKKKEIIDIYYKFLKSMIAMNGEMIALLQIEKNKKQNKLIYESLLSTMKNKRERMLFHGTTLRNIEKIIINGFNRDYNINAKYGKGTYFAESVRYAALYSKKDHKTGHHALLVCRCIIGKYGLGKEHMNTSELYDNDQPGQQYDSLVNDLNDPQIYVINRDYHAIPLYIILFKYKTDAAS